MNFFNIYGDKEQICAGLMKLGKVVLDFICLFNTKHFTWKICKFICFEVVTVCVFPS